MHLGARSVLSIAYILSHHDNASTMVAISSITFPSISALHHQLSIHNVHLLRPILSPSQPHYGRPFQGTVAPIRPLPYDDAADGQICEDVPPAAEHAFASTHGPHASRKHEIRRVSPAYSNVFACAVATSRAQEAGAASWHNTCWEVKHE
jgi:hypothetical protein